MVNFVLFCFFCVYFDFDYDTSGKFCFQGDATAVNVQINMHAGGQVRNIMPIECSMFEIELFFCDKAVLAI